MEQKKGVTETRQLTPLQWQLMMKCWKMNLRPGQCQLVGADGVADGRARAVGVEAAQVERSELHVAAVPVRQRAAGEADGQDGQDSSGAAAEDQEPQGAARRRSSRTSGSTCGPTLAISTMDIKPSQPSGPKFIRSGRSGSSAGLIGLPRSSDSRILRCLQHLLHLPVGLLEAAVGANDEIRACALSPRLAIARPGAGALRRRSSRAPASRASCISTDTR